MTRPPSDAPKKRQDFFVIPGFILLLLFPLALALGIAIGGLFWR